MSVSLAIFLLLIVSFGIKLTKSGSDIHSIAPQYLFHNVKGPIEQLEAFWGHSIEVGMTFFKVFHLKSLARLK